MINRMKILDQVHTVESMTSLSQRYNLREWEVVLEERLFQKSKWRCLDLATIIRSRINLAPGRKVSHLVVRFKQSTMRIQVLVPTVRKIL